MYVFQQVLQDGWGEGEGKKGESRLVLKDTPDFFFCVCVCKFLGQNGGNVFFTHADFKVTLFLQGSVNYPSKCQSAILKYRNHMSIQSGTVDLFHKMYSNLHSA